MENFENIRLPWPDWKIVKYLGGGAYGKVYEIERNISGMQERAALKIVSRPKDESEIESYYNEGYSKAELIASYESEIQNYVQEYKLMKELQGESNIVSCDDFTMIPHDDGIGGDIFIRMELLTSLQQKMRERNLSEQEIIRLGKDISHALVLCKSKNIIHRDIKPANIMVSQFGNYKLGDFGVSKIMDHATFATPMGTPEYQAPEVVHMERYGQAADIYSLGITLYWLLNNRKMPFIGADEQQTPMLKTEAMDRRYRGEKLPAPKNGSKKLKEIVLKACAYRPEDRYASAQEMYDELDALKIGNTQTGKTPKKNKAVKPENHTETEKNGLEESGTIRKAVADDNWNESRETQGNSWRDETETIGKPRKIEKKPSTGQSGFQHSTVKNGFKVTVQNDFREEEKEKRSGAGQSGFQRSTVKNGFKVTVQDDLRTEEQEEFSTETVGVKDAYKKQKKKAEEKKEVVAEEKGKKKDNGSDFFVAVYGVASLLLFVFAFMTSIGHVMRLHSEYRNSRQEFLYRKSIFEVGVSVFVWIGLLLAIMFVKMWNASKSIKIIGPILQIHAILSAIAIPCEEIYLHSLGKELETSGIISMIIGGLICVYFFGGVAYLILAILKEQKK